MRLIYLAPTPWASFHQRPHQFALWFNKRFQGDVLWVDPYPTRIPKLKDFKQFKLKKPATSSKHEVPEWLTVEQVFAFPIEPIPLFNTVNTPFRNRLLQKLERFMAEDQCLIGIGKPTELALHLLKRNPEHETLYDAMDDFPMFYQGISQIHAKRVETELFARVKQIITSSKLLHQKLLSQDKKVKLIPNACAPESLPVLDNQIQKNKKEPLILGYVGTIADWFDWPLVLKIAQENPDAHIRLIGPNHTTTPKALPQNIELLPECDHKTALNAMQHFSIGLIPFKLNELTAAVDPIKFYEYHALGLPIITTAFGEMQNHKNYPGVFITDHSSKQNILINQALSYKSNPKTLHTFQTENSWTKRFDCLLNSLI